jgi:flagellar hook assembly protein FlgD
MVHSPIPTTLKIYNVLGQLVRTLVDQEKLPRRYEVLWDGKDDRGKEVTSGVYFYRLETSGYKETKKMILLK